ncbi:site-specific DNA-methyltransferase [Escherichia coli]|uniref:site-specific DNA-methyltransferase n=1 Tax=Escherichia coli TaxID=562 RepID=UPI001EE1FB3C|nr:site-specific DNA-methyltransferase [Escherichia coli]GJI13758.1 hypothetical protein ECZC14_53960 [Escherichia coli]
MQTELIKELNKVLKAFPQFWNGEELQRSMVSDAISQKQPDLIKALVANEKIRAVYGTDIDGIFIFDFDNLCKFLKYKEYWANSFTKYRNKVGLTSEGKYLDYSSDVVLDFPFKDCVLEGGMTKENQGKMRFITMKSLLVMRLIDFSLQRYSLMLNDIQKMVHKTIYLTLIKVII